MCINNIGKADGEQTAQDSMQHKVILTLFRFHYVENWKLWKLFLFFFNLLLVCRPLFKPCVLLKESLVNAR